MHFSSLILALTAVTAASAATVSKRSFYYPTFLNLNGATEASDYLTYKLVPTIYGEVLAVYSFTRCSFVTVDCFLACNGVAGCNFVNSKPIPNCKDVRYSISFSLP